MAVCATCAYFKEVIGSRDGGKCTYYNESRSKHADACYYYKKG